MSQIELKGMGEDADREIDCAASLRSSGNPLQEYIALLRTDAPPCDNCGAPLSWAHDHRDDNTGLDDGPWLPGRAPRKKIEPKSPEETADIRARAWATRRAKYGKHGHR